MEDGRLARPSSRNPGRLVREPERRGDYPYYLETGYWRPGSSLAAEQGTTHGRRQAKEIIAVEKKAEGGHLRSHCFEIQYIVITS